MFVLVDSSLFQWPNYLPESWNLQLEIELEFELDFDFAGLELVTL